MAESYHDSLMRKKKQRLEEHLKELPPYCSDFFNSKDTTLEPRTLCGYAEDFILFFRYLNARDSTEGKVREIKDSPTDKIPIERIKAISAKDIDNYLKTIGNYIRNGIEYHNGESGKQRKLSSLRMLFRYLCKVGLLESDPTSLVEMPKQHAKKIIILTKENKKEFLKTVLNGGTTKHYQQRAKLEKNRLRDYAIILVLLGTGIRVSELAGLNIADIDFRENRLDIIRKGGDEDSVYFAEDVKKALKEYLYSDMNGCRESFSPRKGEPAVFISQMHNRMSVRSIQKMIKVYADMTFGSGNKYSPHKMRSSYGTALWEETHDLELVSVALGHASVETSKKRYVSISEKQKKRAAIPVI